MGDGKTSISGKTYAGILFVYKDGVIKPAFLSKLVNRSDTSVFRAIIDKNELYLGES